MTGNRLVVLASVLATIALAAAVAWVAGSRIESPADAAARTAPPAPSAILVPVEKRVLGANVVTRGTARFGLPQPVSLAPSALKPQGSVVTTLPARNAQMNEGSVLLTASGRPVFIFEGKVPAYRDLAPGASGDDVRQLELALKRMGFDPGPLDGVYDQQTGVAVARWYAKKGWEPFGPTRDQLAALRALERDWADAEKAQVAAMSALLSMGPAVDAARAAADFSNRTVAVDLATKAAELQRLEQSLRSDAKLTVDDEKAKAAHGNSAADADLAAQIAERAVIELDPRQPETARISANAKLEVARAAAHRARVGGQLAVQAAERASEAVQDKIQHAAAAKSAASLAETSVRLEGEKAVRAAVDAQKMAAVEAKLAAERGRLLSADLDTAKRKIGVQVPVDELVFIPSLPVRVEEVKVLVGAAAVGAVLTVTDNQLAIDSSLSLESAPLVKPGMPASMDEQALGVKATGKVQLVASTPGTRAGVDPLHVYMEIKVDATPVRLEGASVRVTIPIKSTQGAVTAVPNSAVSLAADGTSRVQVKRKDAFEYVVVTPGLSADGFIEVAPVSGKLEPGELVVVGYNNPRATDDTAKTPASAGTPAAPPATANGKPPDPK